MYIFESAQKVAKTIREICRVVQDVLKEVEVQEPRFISSLTEINGRFEGLDVISPGEFEVVLYLNQVGGGMRTHDPPHFGLRILDL